MFEEMLESFKISIRNVILESTENIERVEYPETMKYSELLKMLKMDTTTFENYYAKMLEPAKSRCGKGVTNKSFKWSKRLVIEILNDPRNLELQKKAELPNKSKL